MTEPGPRIVLSCDTSTRLASMALLVEGAVVAERTTAAASGRTTHRLLEDISDMLVRQGLRPADVDLFVTSLGPGSFTGVRVSMATLKGLAFATGRPLAAVSSLEVLSTPLLGRGAAVLAALDARRDEVYAALYGPAGEVLVPAVALAPARVASAVVAAWPAGEVVAVGPGALMYPEVFAVSLAGRMRLASPEDHVVRAAVLARLGAMRPPLPLAEVEPAYLRRSEAEERRAASPG